MVYNSYVFKVLHHLNVISTTWSFMRKVIFSDVAFLCICIKELSNHLRSTVIKLVGSYNADRPLTSKVK